MEEDYIEINKYQFDLKISVRQKIYEQIVEIEKNMKYATIVLMHPFILDVLRCQEQIFYDTELDVIFGLKIIIDESVDIEKMVEVRGIMSGNKFF